MKKKVVYATIFLLLGLSLVVRAQSAGEVLRSMDDVIGAAQDRQSAVKMTLRGKDGKEKVREAVLYQKGRYKKLYRYTKPEKQAGIATLSLPDDEMWVFMPAFGNPIKISLLSKGQAFNNTDFSYEDMTGTTYDERFTPRILDSPDPKVYLLELMPKSMRSRYSKILLHLDKQHRYPIKMEYFDDNKEYFKFATYKYVKQGKYWYAEEVVMTDIKKEHATIIHLSDVKFDQGLPDELFLVENLKPDKTSQ